MNKIILILTVEFIVFLTFAVFIYRLVKKDMKRYRKREPVYID